jgi:hypothetical protein
MKEDTTQEDLSISLVEESKATVSFGLPKDFSIYIEQINEKVNNFINLNIWRGIEKTKLKQWQKNFLSEEEKYFAACILDNLIYRNDDQTESMLLNLLTVDIPNLLLKHKPLNVDPYITIDGFKNATEPNVRLVCVKSEFDSPSKSSHFIARMLKRKMMIHEGWLITPDKIQPCINSGTKCFIFIDDFLGTGNQFNEMGIEILLRDKLDIKDVFFAYAPLTAHTIGIDFLQKEYPKLKLTCVEQLDESNSVFNACFNDGINTPITSKQFYLDFMKRKTGLTTSLDSAFLGYGTLELAYVFQQAVPDNNIPLLYWNSNSSINALFYR